MLDWRNASHYRFPDDLSDRFWAWEFLRRNPEYRRDWEAAVSRFLSKTDEFEEIPDIEAFVKAGGQIVATGERWKDDPEDPGFYLPVDEAEKWRLSGMFNPKTNEPTQLSFNLDFGTVHYIRKGHTFLARGPAFPIVEFNLYLPLQPQFDAVVGSMERTRKHLNIKPQYAKRHRRLWPLYLRLLDATDLDQRTPKQIADVLDKESPSGGLDEKKVWNQLRAARSMTKPEGYLSIFL